MNNVKHGKRHNHNGQFWQNGSSSESGFNHTISINKIRKSLLSKVSSKSMNIFLFSLYQD